VFDGTTQSISGSAIVNPFNNLTIASGTKVTIPVNKNVTVTGTLANNSDSSGLLIESTAAGSASLIHNTEGVYASFQRYLNKDRWYNFTTPLSGQTLLKFLINTANTIPIKSSNYGMAVYVENPDSWPYFTVGNESGNLTLGTGYLLRHTTDAAITSYGLLNSATLNKSIVRAGYGWNCLGNPFPCAIGIRDDASSTDKFLMSNSSQLDPSFAVLYIWDEPTAHYGIISNAGFTPSIDQAYIQPGQGFLVKAKTGGGTVAFTPGMRVHEHTSLLKAAKVTWPGINLKVSSASKTATTAITFHENMTRGLDVTYDAGQFGGDATFNLYSRLVEDNGINFMLQCLPDNDFDNMVIPLGFVFKAGGSVSFSADIYTLPAGCKAILEDKLLGTYTNLQLSAYSVNIDPNTSGIGRFYLHASNVTTNINNTGKPSISIYFFEKEIIVNGMVADNTIADLYDVAGRVIRTFKLEPIDRNVLPVDGISPGVYVIKVFGKLWEESKRVIIE
jgi:hypothetical protein